MSEYQVIARKWRPQTFGDVVGQEHVVRTLKNSIHSGRIAHAYLFVGPRGIGKTTLARIFAKALNCENPRDGEPCCECASCREIAAERSLDVMEVDAASRNSTMDMRELADNTLTRPVSGKYKIYIIDEVHMLSKQAWNVLLKTVEEPPAHVKFIFATTEVHQVLPTIISRCQRFDLQPIPTRLITERLQLIADTEKVAINPAAVAAIARAADGGMRDAQSLLDQMIAFFASGDGSQITEAQVLSLFGLTDREDLYAILYAVLQNNPADVVSRISALAKKGKNLETLFDDLLSALRAIQMCAILPNPEDVLDESPENIARYRQVAAAVSAETVQILLENIASVGRVLHDALNKQIFLETVLLKAMREAHAVRISDILARLNQLRAAGELQFLDKLPVAEKNLPPLPEPVPEVVIPESVPVTEKNLPPLPEEPQEAISESEPVIAAAEPEIATVATEEIVDNSGVDSAESENFVPESLPGAVETEITAELSVAVDVADEIQEDIVPTENSDPIDPRENDDFIGDDDDDTIVDDEFSPNRMPDLLMSTLMSDNTAGKVQPVKSEKADFSPQKNQRSIANDDPQALSRIVSENNIVAEAVDLFSGIVIDIHE